MARAGLRKVTKTVRGKHGASRRSYWVRAVDAVKKHHKALAVGAITLATGALAVHKRQALGSGAMSAAKSADHWRQYGGARLAEKLVKAVGAKTAEHVGTKLGQRVGARIGRKLGRKHVETAKEFGGVIGETIAGHFAERHIEHAGERVAKTLRKKKLFRGSPFDGVRQS